MYFFKKHFAATFTLGLIFLLSGTTKANPGGFTDRELQGFANAVVQVISIQQQGQTLMISAIEEEDMTVQRFNEIMIQTQEVALEDIGLSQEEMDQYLKVAGEIEKIQIDLETVLIETIEEEGLSLDKYEEIMTEYQQNEALQQRIHELVE